MVAIKAIQLSKYTRAFKVLANSSPAARNAFGKVMADMIHKEIRQYCKGERLTSKKVSMESLEAFSWGDLISEIKQELPLTFNCVTSAVTKKSGPL